jgi:hypothetical protein
MKDTWKRWCWDNSVKFIDKDRPKKRTKKVIGEVYGYREHEVDKDDLGVLTEVERLMRQGVEVFTEIPYKSSVIEFYYFTEDYCM